ncbi:Uncharacterized protein OBRU01_08173 [Operophtera brumata]|uniref:MADF domain-containing protein n=1 Tax=Operophtera brumata TaxID=104452 RepID=A0A0L7LII3_OPEBR|nr:Uncharacterized protein OBRU01_08173 [Operophtera brumata]
MSFDTDKFISEIQSRKAIWDLQSEEYANRDLKKKQWEEIVELFGGKELSDEEKKNSGHSLQRKWKNIRSCFSREVRRLKNTKSGSAASHKTPYIYYNQLLFLKNTVGNLNTESNIAEQEHLTNDQEPLGPYSRENIV